MQKCTAVRTAFTRLKGEVIMEIALHLLLEFTESQPSLSWSAHPDRGDGALLC